MVTVSFPGLGIGEISFNKVALSLFGTIEVRWYGIIMVTGIILAFLYAYYRSKHEGVSFDDLLDYAIFTVLSGIVGARLYYVITSGQKYTFGEIFAIWNGGIAIYGAIIGGATALLCVSLYKKIKWQKVFDMVCPGVMIGQIVGRWGNFFNQEVYGKCVDSWTWLPDFLEDRFTYVLTNSGYTNQLLCEEGQMVVPLFLIEGILNVAGWAIITFLVPYIFSLISKKTENKVTMANGTLMGSYFIWYGIVRAVLEPLRNTDFIMGSTDGVNNMTSVYMSIFFVILGIAIIAVCNIFKDKLNPPVLDTNKVETEEVVEKESNEE